MKIVVEGFKLEVAVRDGLPHVRVHLTNGKTVIDTDAVSITGLQRLPVVFDRAARLASLEMEEWHLGQRTANAQEQTGQR